MEPDTRRTIAIITGSRAEYGLLRPLMTRLRDDPAIHLQVIVTGMHLDPRFGLTVQAILEDGFSVQEQVEMLLDDDSPMAVARSMGTGLPRLAAALERTRPKLVILLGDRYEILCAAQAAMVMNIPIAHIHGGEASEGAMDEAIRHAVTKLSHLHFTAAEPYRARVIQMGEEPSRVWNVGALGLDAIAANAWMSKAELEESIDFSLGERFFLVTFHPVTLTSPPACNRTTAATAIEELLAALDLFPRHTLLFTGVNADPGHAALATAIRDYCRDNPQRAILIPSLGQRRYLSAMNHCAAVVGNSSSGILEAPALKVATVNIGMRQQGRLRASSVLDCIEERHAIADTIDQAISPRFQASLPRTTHPFGDGHAAERIMNILKSYPLDHLLIKKFYNHPWKPDHEKNIHHC
ncbi:MAG: UDP-N-acetylglucosamine 2-epimerase (hydrolyzing) [Magnetococcales bacterium]|nr:UDP-N-acetylglucosamine 2-epimerase (hydrolyzing) [Magnetococcales bacterium]